MRSGAVPFKFDLRDLITKAKRQVAGRVGDVTLTLPFVSIAVSPKDREKSLARELVIRLKDRRVLSAWECCDNCIDNSLKSLQDIRRILVDKQVELADVQDGPLFLIIEAMASGIRQFATFEELLRQPADTPAHPRFSEFRRPPDTRQAYFDGLEILRAHLSHCLEQVAIIAGMDIPQEGLIAHYVGAWQLEGYQTPVPDENEY